MLCSPKMLDNTRYTTWDLFGGKLSKFGAQGLAGELFLFKETIALEATHALAPSRPMCSAVPGYFVNNTAFTMLSGDKTGNKLGLVFDEPANSANRIGQFLPGIFSTLGVQFYASELQNTGNGYYERAYTPNYQQRMEAELTILRAGGIRAKDWLGLKDDGSFQLRDKTYVNGDPQTNTWPLRGKSLKQTIAWMNAQDPLRNDWVVASPMYPQASQTAADVAAQGPVRTAYPTYSQASTTPTALHGALGGAASLISPLDFLMLKSLAPTADEYLTDDNFGTINYIARGGYLINLAYARGDTTIDALTGPVQIYVCGSWCLQKDSVPSAISSSYPEGAPYCRQMMPLQGDNGANDNISGYLRLIDIVSKYDRATQTPSYYLKLNPDPIGSWAQDVNWVNDHIKSLIAALFGILCDDGPGQEAVIKAAIALAQKQGQTAAAARAAAKTPQQKTDAEAQVTKYNSLVNEIQLANTARGVFCKFVPLKNINFDLPPFPPDPSVTPSLTVPSSTGWSGKALAFLAVLGAGVGAAAYSYKPRKP